MNDPKNVVLKKGAIELPVALFIATLCIGGMIEASGYRGQSSYMPLAVVGFAGFLALIWIAQSARSLMRPEPERIEIERSDLAKFAFIAFVMVVYVLGVTWIGFFTSTFIMVPALAGILGYRNWTVSLTATVLFIAVLYGVFRLLLSIPLPEEAILGFLGG